MVMYSQKVVGNIMLIICSLFNNRWTAGMSCKVSNELLMHKCNAKLLYSKNKCEQNLVYLSVFWFHLIEKQCKKKKKMY